MTVTDPLAGSGRPASDEVLKQLAHAEWLVRCGEDPRQALQILAPWLRNESRRGFGDWADTRAVLIAADAEFRLARLQRALKHASTGHRLASERGDRIQLAYADCARGRVYHELGRYTDGIALFTAAADVLSDAGEYMHSARARAWQAQLHVSRAEFDQAEKVIARGRADADLSGDAHAKACCQNFLGIVLFNKALTARLSRLRGHWFSALDPDPADPANAAVEEAVAVFLDGVRMANAAGIDAYARLIEGNAMRASILLGKAPEAAEFLRGHIQDAQRRGLRNEEMSRRHTRAWALRICGHFREAAHELEVALQIARRTGRSNRMVGYAHYDRSVILSALGRFQEAEESYRRFVRHVSCWNRRLATELEATPNLAAAPRPLLEPFYLKRADTYLVENQGRLASVEDVAKHAGVSLRTLQLAFKRFRGTTVVAHARNLRLDRARQDLDQENGSVGEIATRHGFESATTFSLEFRRRYGVTPSAVRRMGRRI